MEKLRVLVLDIETSPIKAFVWDTRDQNIAINQIVEDWYIMAFSVKWLGGRQIQYVEARTPDQEGKLLKKLWEYMDTADIIIGQNSKAFDTKKINARFMIHGMNPPSPYKHLDTYLIARNSGSFTKNSLEYLAKVLKCKHQKLSHRKFPGQVLWNECLKGNPEAWAAMKKYNMHDVIVTEELYEKVKAWAPKSAPVVYVTDSNCTVCGRVLCRRGTRTTRHGRVQTYQCKSCGHWSQEKIKKAA